MSDGGFSRQSNGASPAGNLDPQSSIQKLTGHGPRCAVKAAHRYLSYLVPKRVKKRESSSHPFVMASSQQKPQVSNTVTTMSATAERSLLSGKPTQSPAGLTPKKRMTNPFRPAKQLPFTWTVAILSVAAFILTVYYAFNTTALGHSALVTVTPGNTILVLRILSEVTGFLVAALVVGTLERVKWMLVARKEGSSILTFLALAQGTGPLGLISLLNPFAKIKAGRALGIVRVLCFLIVPVLNIVILGNVTVSTVYENSNAFSIAAGIGDFNASWAQDSEVQIVSGILMAKDFGGFLNNPKVAYPMNLQSSDQSSCINGDSTSATDCVYSYYISGGLDLITPWPILDNRLLDSPLYTVSKSQGYYVEFSAGNPSATFDASKDCVLYGKNNGALLLCLSNSMDDQIDMKLSYCPLDVIADLTCTEDTSWQASTGPTLSLRVYRQANTVHYWRSNLTIAAVTDLGAAEPASVSAQDLLTAYNGTFTSSGAAGTYKAGTEFINYFSTYLVFAVASNSTQSVAYDQLRNLLVLPLYYFQPTYLMPGLNPSPDAPQPGLPSSLYTQAMFSTSFDKLIVDEATLLAYTAIGSFIIGLCLIILVLGSMEPTAGGIVDTGPFSPLDLSIGCVSSTSTDELSYLLERCRGVTGNQLLHELKDIRLYVPRDLGDGTVRN